MTQAADAVRPFLDPLPHPTRREIFTALFNWLRQIPPPAGAPAWKTFSQAVKHWDDVPATDQPALFLQRGLETLEQKTFGVTKIHFRALVWIYFRTDGLKTQNTYPDQITDPVLDSIEQLFQTLPPLATRLTLGGTVYHCWIDGTIASEPGLMDNQAVIVVPISILI